MLEAQFLEVVDLEYRSSEEEQSTFGQRRRRDQGL